MKISLFVMDLIVLLGFPAFAADYRSGESVVINAGETMPEDFFAGARDIQISGRMEGDIYAIGEQLKIDGVGSFLGANMVGLDGGADVKRGFGSDFLGSDGFRDGFGLKIDSDAGSFASFFTEEKLLDEPVLSKVFLDSSGGASLVCLGFLKSSEATSLNFPLVSGLFPNWSPGRTTLFARIIFLELISS